MVNWSDRGHVLVTRDKEVVYAQIVGLGNMNNCAPFQEYTIRARRNGVRNFVLDFSKCDGLDSTFLGVLVSIALGDGEPSQVVVINLSESVQRTIDEIGIDRLMTVHCGATALPEIPLQQLQPIEESDIQHAERMLAAHELLCQVEPKNLDQFGAFLSMLRSELDSGNQRRSG